MRVVILFMSLCLANNIVMAQSWVTDEASYQAYVGDKDAQVVKNRWKEIVSQLENQYKQNSSSEVLQQLAVAQYGLLLATKRDKDEDMFDDYIDQTEENLESLQKIKTASGDANALLGAINGLKIAYSPIKGMFLGPKSQGQIEKAMEESPSSPLVWKLYANSKLQTPEDFGGDVNEAIRAFEKSIKLFESSTPSLKNNWLYLDTFAFLGQAYMKNKQVDKAIAIFEKALVLEPNFSWVKFSLLPAARKQQNTSR